MIIFLKWLKSKLEFVSKEDVALMFEAEKRQRQEVWEAYKKIFFPL